MEPFLGQIQLFGFQFAPRGWAQCAGQILAIPTNTALFSLLGTVYGGNGQTTFQLPDLRGRVAIGQGQGPGLQNYNLGEFAGVETMTLTGANLPSHTHQATAQSNSTSTSTSTSTSSSTLNGVNGAANKGNPAGHMLAANANAQIYAPASAGSAVAMDAASVATTTTTNTTTGTTTNTTVTVQPAGNNSPFPLHSPYLCLNYCIALEGVYPSRN